MCKSIFCSYFLQLGEKRMFRKRIVSIIIIALMMSILLYWNWINEAIKSTHIMPEVEQVNIRRILMGRTQNVENMHILSEQTGLAEQVIEKLLVQGEYARLLELQEAYFTPIQTESVKTTPLTICEYIIDENEKRTKGTQLVDIQTGDILVTKNSRFMGWRNGHAGLVVDAEEGLILEAVMLGTNTKLCDVKGWEVYPSFLVLRLKEEYQKYYSVQKAVDYAMENMVDIPYYLFADLLKDKGTHCAHLVWYAYQETGVDLDSDGGFLVTPYDIQNSPYLEVVQSYGY